MEYCEILLHYTCFVNFTLLYFYSFSLPLVQSEPHPPAPLTGTVFWKNVQCQPTLFGICSKYNQNSTLIFVLATDKVALLIGNLNYSNHPNLMAPIMDVHELANYLQQLGFRVVSLLDLTRDEMQAATEKFIQLLDKGVYG